MFQRDYFMRMIEQMSQVAGQVMGLRQERKQDEALVIIDELLDKHFRLNGKLIRSLSDADLVRMMTTSGVIETANIHAIALLMKEEADIFDDQERPELSYSVRLKSFHLFMRLALIDAPPMLRTPSEEAVELARKLSVYELPPETKLLMFEWHEADGRYDQAENMLYELVEDGVLPSDEATEFYRRMLLLPDESLAAGGLSREEVLQGQQQVPIEKSV